MCNRTNMQIVNMWHVFDLDGKYYYKQKNEEKNGTIKSETRKKRIVPRIKR